MQRGIKECYELLKKHCNAQGGTCTPTIFELAQLLMRAENTIRKYLKVLQEQRKIQVVYSDHKRHQISLFEPLNLNPSTVVVEVSKVNPLPEYKPPYNQENKLYTTSTTTVEPLTEPQLSEPLSQTQKVALSRILDKRGVGKISPIIQHMNKSRHPQLYLKYVEWILNRKTKNRQGEYFYSGGGLVTAILQKTEYWHFRNSTSFNELF